jgi:hypothetical protein
MTSIASLLKTWSSRRILRKCFPQLISLGNMAQQNSSLEIIENETFSEEESFTFQSVVFDKESKKLIIEKGDLKNKKGKSRSEVDLKDMRTVPNL